MSFIDTRNAIEALHTFRCPLVQPPGINIGEYQDGAMALAVGTFEISPGVWDPTGSYCDPAIGERNNLDELDQFGWGTIEFAPYRLLVGETGEPTPSESYVFYRSTQPTERLWYYREMSVPIAPRAYTMPDCVEFVHAYVRLRITAGTYYKKTEHVLHRLNYVGNGVPGWPSEIGTLEDSTEISTPSSDLSCHLYGINYDDSFEVLGSVSGIAWGDWCVIDVAELYNSYQAGRKNYAAMTFAVGPEITEESGAYADDELELVTPAGGGVESYWRLTHTVEYITAPTIEVGWEGQLDGFAVCEIGLADGVTWAQALPTLAPPRLFEYPT